MSTFSMLVSKLPNYNGDPIKVAIVGSRVWPDSSNIWIRTFVRSLPPGTTVVSGKAKGVDSTAAAFAREYGLAVKEFPVNAPQGVSKQEYARLAFARNEDIINYADVCVAFWDGKSNGTVNSIEHCLKQKKPVRIVLPDNHEFEPHPEYPPTRFREGTVIYAKGDLLTCKASIIVNPCNTQGIAGAGLSKAIRDRWPAVFMDYLRACELGDLKMGNLYLTEAKLTSVGMRRRVLHFPTKTDPHRPSQYGYIDQGLQYLAKHYQQWPATSLVSIAMPRLGCGLGGLDWRPVRKAIETSLRQFPYPVVIYSGYEIKKKG